MRLVADIATDDLPAAHRVMRQLRPHLDAAAFVAQATRQMAEQGWHLAAAYDGDGAVLGLMGYRFGEYLAWGRILYIDDLVVDEARRSGGVGAALLRLAEDLGRAAGCASVQLDSGTQRQRAHAFYETQGYTFTSHHYCRLLG